MSSACTLNFGECGLSGFGDIATFKNGQISLFDHGLSMVIKKFNRLELAQKIHASRDWCNMQAHQFWWESFFQFWRYCYFQKRPNFPFRPWTIPWSSKNLIDWNRLKKFMHVRVYVKCMHTNFGECGLSGFGDIATFKNGQISLFDL